MNIERFNKKNIEVSWGLIWSKGRNFEMWVLRFGGREEEEMDILSGR